MASIHFVCPVCAQNLKVSGALAGRKGRCPFCSAKVRIPPEDHGVAEILDDGRKQDASDVAPVPGGVISGVSSGPSDDGAQAALGPSVMVHADDGLAAGQPVVEASNTPPEGGDLQSQFDRELGGADSEHHHAGEAATLRYSANQPPPVIQPEAGAMPVLRLQPNAPADPVKGEPPALESPPAPPGPGPAGQKVETIKYDAAHNPARRSGEQRTAAVPTTTSGDRFVETRERAGVPAAATPTTPPPDLPEVHTSRDHRPALVASTSSGPAAIPPLPQDPPALVAPTAAAAQTNVGEFFAEQSENQVGDSLAALPKERTRPTTALGSLAARAQTPSPIPAAVPVASMQTPVLPVPTGAAAGSLIGDRCDPSRHGQSALPVILWIVLVVLSLGGVTTWLVVDGLHRRTASIQASQAFLRVSDLAAAQGEYFNSQRSAVAGPSALATAPATGVAEASGGEYAASLAELQARKLLNPVLWKEGVEAVTGPGPEAAKPPANGSPAKSPPAAKVLAVANGYRYVLWYSRVMVAGQPPLAYVEPPEQRLTRGFAVAAIPIDSGNWAYAIDDRGRLIQWRHTPLAPGEKPAPASGKMPDPVQAGHYPADSDFAKIPIR